LGFEHVSELSRLFFLELPGSSHGKMIFQAFPPKNKAQTPIKTRVKTGEPSFTDPSELLIFMGSISRFSIPFVPWMVWNWLFEKDPYNGLG